MTVRYSAGLDLKEAKALLDELHVLTTSFETASYVLGRLLRTTEKYITAKAASNTPPTIKIKVVTIAQFSPAGPYNIRHRRPA